MHYINDETRYEFPVRLCNTYSAIARNLGLTDIADRRKLCDIDDVKNVLEMLETQGWNSCGEEIEDDMYRLCSEIEQQWQQTR